jgi:hypothetical protein
MIIMASAVVAFACRCPTVDLRFKVYFLSVIEREQPHVFDWQSCDYTPDDFENRVNSGIQGVGFITVFWRITKVFRYSSQIETVVDVGCLDTRSFEGVSSDRGEGYYEFACYAEAVIVADEYHVWANAKTAPDYLEVFSASTDYPFAWPGKLATYWNSAE